MNDRYLYKAKQKNWRELPKEEHWVYGYYVRGFNECEEPIDIMFEPTSVFSSNGKTDGWDEIDPTTLCACTGLKDKNGKLIWENDIVKWCGNTRKVSYYDSVCSFVLASSIGCWKRMEMNYGQKLECFDYEVVGNIFDNPELLEN